MAKPANSVPLHINTDLDLDLGPRFAEICPKGFGANGIVYSATDKDCDKKVAVKRITFGDSISCKYALREIMILRRMQHENIVGTHEILGLNGKSLDCEGNFNLDDLHSVYIVQDLLDTDLYNVIQSGQMTDEHIKFFQYQLLRGLKYLHSANVVHRDLKPSNILINCDNLMLKIADFGLSRVIDPDYDHGGSLTENMGTAWYRSPEQILHPRNYNKAVDMWSAGCIFAEMLTGRPLCRGVDDLDQLLQILDTIQLQDGDWDEVLTILSNKALKNHPLKITVPLRERLALVDPQAIDMLESLLVFNSEMRLTAEEALKQPFMREFSCVYDEPIALSPLHIEYEVDHPSVKLMRQMILEEINNQETCGSQTDWLGWEALHAVQTSHEESQCMVDWNSCESFDDYGNISPEPVIKNGAICKEDEEDMNTIDDSIIDVENGKNVQRSLSESPTDFEMSNKFFNANLMGSPEHEWKMAAHPTFEMNKKYLVEEKESESNQVETEKCHKDEEGGCEQRESLKNFRNTMQKASPIFQPCIEDIFSIGDHHPSDPLEFKKNKWSDDKSSTTDADEDTFCKIISYDSDEENTRNIFNFNMKNNALNSDNDIKENQGDQDIFKLRDKPSSPDHNKDIKHDIVQEIAFKEEFNLRQKLNSDKQFNSTMENQCSGFDFSWKRSTANNNQNNRSIRGKSRAIHQDYAVENHNYMSATNAFSHNKNNHLTNERLRKNLMSKKLMHFCNEKSHCCDESFLSCDSACCTKELSSGGSLDWILFSTNSGLPFPPLQVPIGQRGAAVDVPDIMQSSHMYGTPYEEESNLRAHPSGAKPKKFCRKTKAL